VRARAAAGGTRRNRSRACHTRLDATQRAPRAASRAAARRRSDVRHQDALRRRLPAHEGHERCALAPAPLCSASPPSAASRPAVALSYRAPQATCLRSTRTRTASSRRREPRRGAAQAAAASAGWLTPPRPGPTQERNGGNYGSGTQELQRRNYIERKELEKKRTDMFNEAIAAFNRAEYEAALIVFENIVGLEPKNYIGDNFEKVTNLYRVAQYNIACCYSCLGAVEPGLEALQVAMSVGFDDFRKIRTDPSLKQLQQSDKFKKLLDKARSRFTLLYSRRVSRQWAARRRLAAPRCARGV
jgi:tetratricopeptide (TPR) repeat protein